MRHWHILACTDSYDPSIHLSIGTSIRLSIYASTYPPIHPSIHLSTYLSIHLSACPPIHPSVHLSIDPSSDQCINPSIHQSIYISIHLSISTPLHAILLPFAAPLEASKPSVVGGLWKARRAKTEDPPLSLSASLSLPLALALALSFSLSPSPSSSPTLYLSFSLSPCPPVPLQYVHYFLHLQQATVPVPGGLKLDRISGNPVFHRPRATASDYLRRQPQSDIVYDSLITYIC